MRVTVFDIQPSDSILQPLFPSSFQIPGAIPSQIKPSEHFKGQFWISTHPQQLWRIYHSTGGRFHQAISRQHEIYGEIFSLLKLISFLKFGCLHIQGPVFRVSPNELSFASVSSWKGIYGYPPPTQQTLIKSKFYEIYGSGFSSLCIGSERDPKKHSQMKKSLSGAFSTKSLMEQEEIIKSCVDAFVTRIGKDGGPGSRGLNMTKWYEMVSFDILGEMAFGESFHCIKNGTSLTTLLKLRENKQENKQRRHIKSIRKATFLGRTYRRSSLLHNRCRQPPPLPTRCLPCQTNQPLFGQGKRETYGIYEGNG